jgi:hypothetical protein
MSTRIGKAVRGTVVALAAMMAAAGAAEAVDVRSWDQKITDPGKRFVVLAAFNNEAVLDKETQLVWMRTPVDNAIFSGATPTAYQAGYVCPQQEIGGRTGWRLPFVHELMTLVDRSAPAAPKLPAGHPFIGVGPQDNFWTATAMPGLDGYVMFVQMYNGLPAGTVGNQVLLNFHALCVRGHGAQP